MAGLQQGGNEGSGTRSSLMYETIRIVKKLNPKYIIWENVKNLLSKKHIHNFNNYITILDKLGYNNYYQVLNAKDYQIPQQRERVFTISIRKDIKKDFIFPNIVELKYNLEDFLDNDINEKLLVPKEKYNHLITTLDNYKEFNSKKIERITGIFDTKSSKHQAGSIYSKKGIAPTLDTMQGGYRQPLIYYYIDNEIYVRKITPIECFKLMGFDKIDCEKLINNKISNTQLYKQAGNSICVKCLEAIIKNLLIF